ALVRVRHAWVEVAVTVDRVSEMERDFGHDLSQVNMVATAEMAETVAAPMWVPLAREEWEALAVSCLGCRGLQVPMVHLGWAPSLQAQTAVTAVNQMPSMLILEQAQRVEQVEAVVP